MSYWYNVSKKLVETDEDRGPAAEVLGPFATRAEAQAALESARQRTEAWERDEQRED